MPQYANLKYFQISHIFESGANHLRIFEMVENFIDKRYKAINYTHCCESDSELLAEHKCKFYVNADWSYLRCDCGKRIKKVFKE